LKGIWIYMNKPLISVIIPVYNVEAYLDRCISSVVNQSYRNLEIILVDDGSPDNCPKMCDDWAAEDERIKVIHKVNGGLSSARNVGIDCCSGDYIGFVDSDDWIDESMYEILYDLSVKYGVKLACAGRFDVNESGKFVVGLCPEITEVIDAEKMLSRIFTWNNCDSSVCDKLFHRDLWNDIRFPEGKVCEDVSVAYRLIALAEKIVLCNVPFYYYYHRKKSITTAKFSENVFHFAEHSKIILEYIKDNFPTVTEEAKYFNIKALTYAASRISLSDKMTRKNYHDKHKELLNEINTNKSFWRKSEFFNIKEKLRYELLSYPFLYRLIFK